MATLSSHLLNSVNGTHASGVSVVINQINPSGDKKIFFETKTDESGRILVHDPYTTIFAIGFVGPQGIWITRDALNYNTTPDWIRIGDAPGGWSGRLRELFPFLRSSPPLYVPG